MGETTSLTKARDNALAYIDPGNVVQRGRIEAAETEEEIQEILAEVVGETAAESVVRADKGEVEEIVAEQGGSAYIGQEEAEGIAIKSGADPHIEKIVDRALENKDLDLTHEDLAAAYLTTNTADAVQAILAAVEPSDLDSREIIGEMFPEQMSSLRANLTYGGQDEDGNWNASKEKLAIVYDGEFADNHDTLVENGWLVKFDLSDNIFYIEPGDGRTVDINGNDIGQFDKFTGEIRFLDSLPDSRRPYFVEDGAFIPEGANVNVVAATPTISLKDWHDLYGGTATGGGFADSVTRKTYEDVLKDDLSLSSGMRDLIQRGLFPFEEEYSIETIQVPLHFQYLKGDATNMLIDMPREDLSALQQRASDLGVYKIGTLGLIDPQILKFTETGMSAGNENYEGDPQGFVKSLHDFEASQEYTYNWFGGRPSGGGSRSSGGGTTRIWRPPAYLAPDYAELSQAVKATFEQKLGRAPSDAEVKLLSVKMGTDHRGEFDAQAAAQKLQFFASGGTSAGTVQDVNYAARFQEDFGSKYQDELGTLDKIQMSRGVTQAALGSILAADRAIGG